MLCAEVNHSLALGHQIFAVFEPYAKEICVDVSSVQFQSHKAFSETRVINIVWVDLFKQDHAK